jgi:hypothetical protein
MSGESFFYTPTERVVGVREHSGACPDCDATTALVQIGKGAFVVQVRHDATCPWLARHEGES